MTYYFFGGSQQASQQQASRGANAGPDLSISSATVRTAPKPGGWVPLHRTTIERNFFRPQIPEKPTKKIVTCTFAGCLRFTRDWWIPTAKSRTVRSAVHGTESGSSKRMRDFDGRPTCARYGSALKKTTLVVAYFFSPVVVV